VSGPRFVDAPEHLQSLCWTAMDIAVASAIKNGGFVPVVHGQYPDGRGEIKMFAHEDSAQALREARRYVTLSADKFCRAAVVWDGFLTANGVKTMAIFVECQERGVAHSHLLAQRYRPKRWFRKGALVENSKDLGAGEGLFP
jgi:hypothetical protein